MPENYNVNQDNTSIIQNINSLAEIIEQESKTIEAFALYMEKITQAIQGSHATAN